jgi:hypothetical protein
VTEPERGVLIEGKAYVDAAMGALVRDLLFEDGWNADEPWTPLRRDLTEPVRDPGVRIEAIGPEQAHVRTAVQRASFDRPTFTEERWCAMANGLPYADARCVVAHDDQGNAVAAVTVWSAGRGEAQAARADGRAPGTSRSGLRQGDHRRRGGSTPGSGLVQRDRLHPELQCRRRRNLQVSRVPATP